MKRLVHLCIAINIFEWKLFGMVNEMLKIEWWVCIYCVVALFLDKNQYNLVFFLFWDYF